MKTAIKLGSIAEDCVSGFSGMVTARTQYLYGCVRYMLEPKGVKEDGSPRDVQWFDEQRLVDTPAVVDSDTLLPGGPQEDAPSH